MEDRIKGSEPVVEVQDLDMGYGDFILMRDLNFAVNKGDIFIIMGGSGCGKSTLMKIMVGLKEPLKGKVLFDEISLWDADPKERKQIMRRLASSIKAERSGVP